VTTEPTARPRLEPLELALPPVDHRPTVPAGFAAGSTIAGIKASGRPDLVIIATTGGPAAAAAVFTANAFAAAPVRLSQQHLAATEPSGKGRFGWADAVISTSGCANAATGAAGAADQAEVAAALAAALGSRPDRILTLSTGLIGTRLPVGKVTAGISALIGLGLGAEPASLEAAAIEAVARDLARQQAADGEGASTLLTCQVSGALDDADARAVARAVVSSSLFKAAVHGRDPNWGRIAGAAGNARLAESPILEAAGLPAHEARARGGTPATIDPDRVQIAIAGTLVFDGPNGGPQPFDKAALRALMEAPETIVRIDLGLGTGTGEAFGCDLTEEYVIENSEYST